MYLFSCCGCTPARLQGQSLGSQASLHFNIVCWQTMGICEMDNQGNVNKIDRILLANIQNSKQLIERDGQRIFAIMLLPSEVNRS
jgi:hypothetical protein